MALRHVFGKALVKPVSMQAEGRAANGPVCIGCLLLEVRDGVSGRGDGAAQLSVPASGSRWFFGAENYPVLPSLANRALNTVTKSTPRNDSVFLWVGTTGLV